MKEKKDGYFTIDGNHVSKEQIKRKLAIEGHLPDMRHQTPIKLPLSLNHILQRATERSVSMKEQSPRSDREVKVHLPRTSIINVIGDTHFGHPETDNKRIAREVEIITNSPDSYVILNGDLVDGLFWGGASGGEQTANLDEQRGFLRGMFDKLKGRVIVGTSGEHDSKWASRSGADPYSDFSERTGAPYVRGNAEVEVEVGDQTYKVSCSHRKRGHSMYNKNHPTYREARFELQDADIYINSHTHTKQISQESIRKFGRADTVTHISTGPYKAGDDYGDRSGFIEQKPEQMYGAALRLHADRKKVDIEKDIVEAHRQWVDDDSWKSKPPKRK